MGGRSTGKPTWPGIEWLDEVINMQFAAIMTASIQNTNETTAERIDKDNPYWTVAYSDVCRAVDREMAHRRELEFMKAEHKDVQEEAEKLKKQLFTLDHQHSIATSALDKMNDRSVGAMAIAEGDQGWERIPIDCPTLEAVAKLRTDFNAAMKDLATLRACVGSNP